MDSRTTALSKASAAAKLNGVGYLERDFFLDNIVTEEAIIAKIEESIKYAKREGLAVAIGHPYPETLTLLSERLPKIENRGVELMWASSAITKKKR